MCDLNFYGSDVTIIKWPGEYSQELHLKRKFIIAAKAHLSTTLAQTFQILLIYAFIGCL